MNGLSYRLGANIQRQVHRVDYPREVRPHSQCVHLRLKIRGQGRCPMCVEDEFGAVLSVGMTLQVWAHIV